jgi:protein-L-isoaspartate(D-aspartate) O-methyltransferase
MPNWGVLMIGTNRAVTRLGAVVLVWSLSVIPGEAQTRTLSRAQLDAARKRMVDVAVVDAGVRDPRVIDAMLKTPRHEFVPRAERHLAYEDMAIPIGEAQTISSPFIVAFMTEAIEPQPTDRVLEIGTGSGYQAAVLSGLVREVFTIEIVESLGRQAERVLRDLKYTNVHVRVGDGFQGWPAHAPFDKILVTCSPEQVPQPLIDQLREGGRIVIPVGERYQQTLYLFTKRDGRLEQEALRPTLFVPMTGTAEEQREVLPDPLRPTLGNGGFEEPPLATGFIPHWYYQRQLTRVADEQAPEGQHYIRIRNQQPGKPALTMQGFPVDGTQVAQLDVSAWVRYESVRRGRDADERPAIVITFYDQDRKPLGNRWIGPFQGTAAWHRVRETLRVPVSAREAIVRLGLFGAVGEIAFDDIRVDARARP